MKSAEINNLPTAKASTVSQKKLHLPILLVIAIRNLREHKAKSLIVGVLIALGIFILILGNSVLATAAKGIETTYINSYTGHVFVRPISRDATTISGTFGPPGSGVQTLPNYSEVYDYVKTLPEVVSLNPQITLFASIEYTEEGGVNQGAFLQLLGIEPESYANMFPDNLNITEGRFLSPDERGLVLNKQIVDEIREVLEIDIAVGDELKISLRGGPQAGFRIRRLPLVGVYEFSAGDDIAVFSFMDASTARSLNGMVVGSSDVIEIDEDDSTFLDISDVGISDDSLFGDDIFADAIFSDDSSTDDLFADDGITEVAGEGELDLLGILGDTSDRAIASVPDAGAWSYLLVKLQSTSQMQQVINTINAHLQSEGIAVEAVDWSIASGGTAQFNQAIQIFFYVIVAILTIVSVIIIMNTLVISVIARTKEIGTMRSLGAFKGMVRKMFISETMSISLIFGSIGMIIGIITIVILNFVALEITSPFLQTVFGGDVLKPLLSPNSLLLSFAVMLGIGLISSLYPVLVALRIQPLEAMQSI